MDNKERCPTCGHTVSERRITLFTGLIPALFNVYRWCRERDTYEFTRKDIKHLLEGDNQRARFGDLILFGGLIHRPKGKGKGHYGIDLERTRRFFAGTLAIPITAWKNPVTKALKKEDYRSIRNIPHLTEFLNEHQEFLAEYRPPSGSKPYPLNSDDIETSDQSEGIWSLISNR